MPIIIHSQPKERHDIKVTELAYPQYTPTSHNIQPLTGEWNNNDHLVTKQCASGKLWFLAFMWMQFQHIPPFQRCCRSTTTPHCNGITHFFLQSVFGWVVHVKLHPHEFQDSRFSSRTFDCIEIINVIHFTCQWFSCCG